MDNRYNFKSEFEWSDSMKIKKNIAPILAAFSLNIVSALLNNKNPENTSSAVSEPEEMFGGLQQSEIDELVNTTYKGIKADIKGDTLVHWYIGISLILENVMV